MEMRKGLAFIAIASFALVAGCSSHKPVTYSWGSYEGFVYNMYHKPHKAAPLEQIQTLALEIQEIEAQGGLVGPGVHAHLGYMYYLVEDYSKAEAFFSREKTLYPESTVFVDRMIANLPQK